MSVRIRLQDVSKKINYQTIYSGLSADMHSGRCYGIKGPNGSGKSTLLQCIIGYDSISTGTLDWYTDAHEIAEEAWMNYYSFSAPYAEIIEDFTVDNFLKFIASRWPETFSTPLVEDLLVSFDLSDKKDSSIHKLSSGQKQKVNLIQAMASTKPVMILDEPTSFLDHKSIEVYREILQSQKHKLIIIASNAEHDFPEDVELIELT